MKYEQTRNELPEGWSKVKMGEVFTIERGGSPRPIDEFITEDENGINWIKIGDTKGVTKYITQTKEKIKSSGAARSRMVYEGDFVLSNSMSFGRPYIMRTSGCIHDGWLVIRQNDRVDKDFLYHSLSSNEVYSQFSKLAKGSTVKNLNIEAVKQVEIILPPKEQQKQIVSKIEELFSELDKGIEELKTAQQQLKVYRQAVLKWAFEGKLTNKDIRRGELPDGWKWKTLGEICDPQRKCSYGVLVPGDHVENGVTLLRVGDIDDRGIIDQSNMKKISPQIANKFKRTFLQGGEVVISLVGAIGRTAVVPNSLAGANTARAIGVIPVSKDVSAKFVEAMLRSPGKIRQHNDSSHEVARKTLNLEDVIKSKIPLPPFEEQQQIVQEIESRVSVCDKIEETIVDSLKQAEALRQSILKKAINGQLRLNFIT